MIGMWCVGWKGGGLERWRTDRRGKKVWNGQGRGGPALKKKNRKPHAGNWRRPGHMGGWAHLQQRTNRARLRAKGECLSQNQRPLCLLFPVPLVRLGIANSRASPQTAVSSVLLMKCIPSSSIHRMRERGYSSLTFARHTAGSGPTRTVHAGLNPRVVFPNRPRDPRFLKALVAQTALTSQDSTGALLEWRWRDGELMLQQH